MRVFALLASLLWLGCGEATAPPPRAVPVLRAWPVAPGAIILDGTVADDHWKRYPDLVVPLEGAGEVRLQAAYDDRRLYLLARWHDAERSMNRYWKYLGQLKWEKFTGEDAFSIWWSPGSLADAFRTQGCALFCHDGRHVYLAADRGFADVWYYGTQTCALFPQARDMRLPFGERQRLRGDRQPADSDNLANISDVYEGPRYWPFRLDKAAGRLMRSNNVNEVTPDRMKTYMRDESNIGREIPLDILQERKGSRGDVAYAARFYRGSGYVLELVRDLRTGEPDDIVLDPDPLVPYLFAVAIHDGTAGAAHAISGPVELRFVARK